MLIHAFRLLILLLPIAVALLLHPQIHGRIAIWYWTRQWRAGRMTFSMQNYEASRLSARRWR